MLGQRYVALNSHEAEMNPSLSCPRCGSLRLTTRDYARKAGGAIGAASSAAAAFGGAEAGAAIGLVAGPVGSIFGAIFGALVAGAAGCAAGSALGAKVDEHVLSNFVCLECDHTFSKPCAT